MKGIRGIDQVRSNFDYSSIPKQTPFFYKKCFLAWEQITKATPKTVQEVAIQPLWNNKELKHNLKLDKHWHSVKLYSVKDLIHPSNRLKYLSEITDDKSDLYQARFLHYQKLIKAIPCKWSGYIKQTDYQLESIETDSKDYILLGDEVISIKSITSSRIYKLLIKNQYELPSSQISYDKIIKTTLNWNHVYENIYKTTLGSYLRQFQFKVVHNYLTVNSKLYKWKLVGSNRCSYCFLAEETVEHLFCYCPTAVTLYRNIQSWCASIDVDLPDINIIHILFGILPWKASNAFMNTVLLIYKLLLFEQRTDGSPSLQLFQVKLKELKAIEYKVATNKNKQQFHFYKWNACL